MTFGSNPYIVEYKKGKAVFGKDLFIIDPAKTSVDNVVRQFGVRENCYELWECTASNVKWNKAGRSYLKVPEEYGYITLLARSVRLTKFIKKF